MDDLSYAVDIRLSGGASMARRDAHSFDFTSDTGLMELSLRFSPNPQDKQPPAFDGAKRGCAAFWESYWESGGIMRITGTDPRAAELERRAVLSQYLTAIQSRGELPPAETGLTMNSWYGKFHVEMHLWHTAHFPLWGRREALEKQLIWYKKTLPAARDIAASQGYKGARWPKMCDVSGYNSPSPIAVLLVWQQPHPILLAELCRRQNPSRVFMEEYREVIVETAQFIYDFIHWDGSRYVVGAPYIPAQERFDPRTVLNAGFETEYFRLGLRLANKWLEALGEPAKPEWAYAADKLAEPYAVNGVYPAHENCPETFDKPPFQTDHPSMAAMLGLLPGEGVDKGVMAATVDKILAR